MKVVLVEGPLLEPRLLTGLVPVLQLEAIVLARVAMWEEQDIV